MSLVEGALSDTEIHMPNQHISPYLNGESFTPMNKNSLNHEFRSYALFLQLVILLSACFSNSRIIWSLALSSERAGIVTMNHIWNSSIRGIQIKA